MILPVLAKTKMDKRKAYLNFLKQIEEPSLVSQPSLEIFRRSKAEERIKFNELMYRHGYQTERSLERINTKLQSLIQRSLPAKPHHVKFMLTESSAAE